MFFQVGWNHQLAFKMINPEPWKNGETRYHQPDWNMVETRLGFSGVVTAKLNKTFIDTAGFAAQAMLWDLLLGCPWYLVNGYK